MRVLVIFKRFDKVVREEKRAGFFLRNARKSRQNDMCNTAVGTKFTASTVDSEYSVVLVRRPLLQQLFLLLLPTVTLRMLMKNMQTTTRKEKYKND